MQETLYPQNGTSVDIRNSKKAAGAQLEFEACMYSYMLKKMNGFFQKWFYSPSTMRPSERMHLTLPLASEATIDEELKVKQA